MLAEGIVQHLIAVVAPASTSASAFAPRTGGASAALPRIVVRTMSIATGSRWLIAKTSGINAAAARERPLAASIAAVAYSTACAQKKTNMCASFCAPAKRLDTYLVRITRPVTDDRFQGKVEWKQREVGRMLAHCGVEKDTLVRERDERWLRVGVRAKRGTHDGGYIVP